MWISKVAQMENNLPAMQETQVPSLGMEDALEKGMAAHSSILAWRIPWAEEPGGLQSIGSQSDTTEPLSLCDFYQDSHASPGTILIIVQK